MMNEMVAVEQDQVTAVFDFSTEELALNRAGRLSERQRGTLKFNLLEYLKRVGLAVLVAIIGSVLGTIGILFGGEPIVGDINWWVVYGIIALGTVVAIIWLSASQVRAWQDARDGTVTTVQGMVKIIEPTGGQFTIGGFQVRDDVFRDLTQEQFELMRTLKGEKVTVYISPRVRRFMALELG